MTLPGLLAPATSHAAPRIRQRTKTVAPGVVLRHISDPRGPYQIHVLTINPAKKVALDVTLAGAQLGPRAKTSQMVRANNAIAGINGDFFTASGQPMHAMADGGSLVQSGFQVGASFAYSANEQRNYIGSRIPHVYAQDKAAGKTWWIDRWNSGPPRAGEVAAYTSVGGSLQKPPSSACNVRLQRSGGLTWTKTGQSLRPYRVVANRCTGTSVSPGELVLSANNGGAKARILRRLPLRSTVDVRSGFGWRNVLDEIAGKPVILRKGKNIAPAHCGSYFCDRNPRTGIGYKKNGDVVLMTVDGRIPNSVGMTLPQFAAEFRKLGCTWAMNLDGGGSTTMVVRGTVVNQPSDGYPPGYERDVSNALIVLPRPESKMGTVATGAAAPVLGPPDPAAAQASWQQELSDPGSTGGLLQAMASGGLGSAARRSMSPALRRLAASLPASLRPPSPP